MLGCSRWRRHTRRHRLWDTTVPCLGGWDSTWCSRVWLYCETAVSRCGVQFGVADAVAELLRDPVAAQRRAARAQVLPIAQAWQESGESEFVNIVEELGSSADQ